MYVTKKNIYDRLERKIQEDIPTSYYVGQFTDFDLISCVK